MVRTIIEPQNNTISLLIPNDYVGKKLEVMIYADDEIWRLSAGVKSSRPKISSFKGILTNDEAEKYHQYLQKSRQEWDRNI